MEEYGLQNNYYKSDFLWEGELDKEENFDLSNKELAIKYNVITGIIKKYRKVHNLPAVYSLDRTKELINLYDINGQGFIKQIKLDDEILFNSIEHYTKDHKLTEKIYRILHDVTKDEIFTCIYCDKYLKFYTLELGYGSENNFCRKCLPKHNGFGVSKVSQKLFWEIYN